MGGIFLMEFLVAEGIIMYRDVKEYSRPPMPGRLLAVSGAFILLAILAEASPGARKLAVTIGAGLDIAAFLNVYRNPPKATPASTAKHAKQKGTSVSQLQTGKGTGPEVTLA